MKLSHPTINFAALPDEPGIYAIRCIVTGQQYIGGTCSIQMRARQHFAQLRDGIHCNKLLSDAYGQHGAKAFTLDVLETCSLRKLNLRELHFYNTTNHELNCCPPAPIKRTAESLKTRKEAKRRREMLLLGKW